MSEKPGFLETYSPWSSRSATPKPGESTEGKEKAKDDPTDAFKGNKSLPDHAVSGRWHLSSKDYPKDCPKLLARWFYATDAPKRKAQYANAPPQDSETLPKPKKYSAFSARDSHAIEAAFQKLIEKDASQQGSRPSSQHGDSPQENSKSLADTGVKQEGTSIGLGTTDDGSSIRVPVNEDFLFDVDVQRRELGPAYWLGPIYDVRRGSWFYQEGSNLRPCDENL